MTGLHEIQPSRKPCRVLRALGRCTQEPLCSFPLGLNGCFSRYDEDQKAGRVAGQHLVSMLDMTIALSEQAGDGGKRVLVFTPWY